MWSVSFRWRQKGIERAMDLTDNFTWEDLPIRDADTGQLTAAGWIPLIRMFTSRIVVSILTFACAQLTIRIVTKHETLYNTWYPFDWIISPFYEMVIISQVTLPVCYKNKKSPRYGFLLFLI